MNLRFPSWNELNEKISELEKKAAEKISEFKSGHPIVAGALSGLFSIFPPPLNSIAQGIFDNADGSDEDKTNAVVGYFKNLQMQGEDHYNRVAAKLDGLFMEIGDLKQVTAKERTLEKIQEFLITSGKQVDIKFDLIKDDLGQIRTKVNTIDKKVVKLDEKVDNRFDRLEQLLFEGNKTYERHELRPEIVEGQQINIPSNVMAEIKKRDEEINRLSKELAESGQKIKIDINYLLKTANAYYYTKNYEKAIGLYDLILGKDPNNLDALNNKGIALHKQGKHKQAISCYEKVLKINPKSVYALNNKGIALDNLHNYKKAILCFDKVLRINRKNTFALNNKGYALQKLGKPEEAISYYGKTLKIDPNNKFALQNEKLCKRLTRENKKQKM